jgi:uncharacterized protein YjbJ (UPF0337 family)
MNKDRVEGKLKDVTGRVERQAGEWLGDTEKQAHGALKQAEGKVQNTWGKVKDAGKTAADDAKAEDAKAREQEKRSDEAAETEADIHLRRKAG